ncbi:hypothetical protein RFI_29439, partial [Reticulomyxa filosa]
PLFQLSWKPSLSANLNTTVRVVRNALVAMIGISEYDDNSGWPNHPNIKKNDIVNFKNLFEKELNYDFVHNQKARMTKEDVQEFFDDLMRIYPKKKFTIPYTQKIDFLYKKKPRKNFFWSRQGFFFVYCFSLWKNYIKIFICMETLGNRE